MTIEGIDTVVYGVEDMAVARKFLTDWGLKKVSSAKTRAVFATQEGSQVVIRPKDAPDLPAAVEPGSTLREMIWGVSSKKALEALRKELERDREVRVDADGSIHTVDPYGIGLGFRVWKHKKVKPGRAGVNTPGGRERVDIQGPFYKQAAPMRMGHIVYSVGDLVKGERFYRDRLGFCLSDRYVNRGVFLRCKAESDHHNLFLLRRDDGKTLFNHVAFEVRDIHEVFGGGLNISRHGWKTAVGPGRHPVSSAYFWYFHSPCGGHMEYFADTDYLTDKWKPHVMPKMKPETFAEWVLADGFEETHDYRADRIGIRQPSQMA